jgi:hypothetical protein
MGIALRDQSGNLRRSEDLLGEVADAFSRIEDPAERVRLAFKLFDSEGVALVNLLSDGSDALDGMRERAHDLGIVLSSIPRPSRTAWSRPASGLAAFWIGRFGIDHQGSLGDFQIPRSSGASAVSDEVTPRVATETE